MRYIDNIMYERSIDPNTFRTCQKPNLQQAINDKRFNDRRIIQVIDDPPYHQIISEDI